MKFGELYSCVVLHQAALATDKWRWERTEELQWDLGEWVCLWNLDFCDWFLHVRGSGRNFLGCWYWACKRLFSPCILWWFICGKLVWGKSLHIWNSSLIWDSFLLRSHKEYILFKYDPSSWCLLILSISSVEMHYGFHCYILPWQDRNGE